MPSDVKSPDIVALVLRHQTARFWHHRPGDSIRAHKLCCPVRLHLLPLLRRPIKSPGCHPCSCLEIPMTPPPQFSSVQLVAQSCPTLGDPMDCSTPGLPVHHQLPKLAQTHAPWDSDAIQPSHPLSPPSPPTFNLSQHQGLSNESVLCIRWPKYWSFSFSISPSNEYSGLISFRMDWLDLLAVQETLKSLLQHQSSKASILRCSAFL